MPSTSGLGGSSTSSERPSEQSRGQVEVVGNDRVRVEFLIEDLVDRLIGSSAGAQLASHCKGCTGCNGCRF
jgi:hypothetical protein